MEPNSNQHTHTHNMLESQCLGCKRYFISGQKLPLQSMTVQFKNYTFPFKQSTFKHNILRTIVAFLNSKGGLILIGVEDSTGQVQGIQIQRKQMDQFKLMIKQMLEKVQPQVDLVKHQEVSIDFVPILQGKDKLFHGKYIVKFIVLQGNTSKLYCISQKVKVTGYRLQEGEVVSAFRRHNLGGIQEIRGIKVIHQLYEKATNPHKVFKTFHEGCNPSPATPMLSSRPVIQTKKQLKQTKIKTNITTDNTTNINNNSILNVPKINSKTHLNQQKSQNLSSSSLSDNTTLINAIREIERNEKPLMKNILKKQQNKIYISNLKQEYIQTILKFVLYNFNSNIQKTVKIKVNHVQVTFLNENDLKTFLQFVQKPKIKNVISPFFNKSKISISQKPFIQDAGSQQQKSKVNKSSQQTIFQLVFTNYDQKFEKSLENYLMKCMTKDLTRKLTKSKGSVILTFQKQNQMNIFCKLCNEVPHCNQLSNYTILNKELIIKKTKYQFKNTNESRQSTQIINKINQKQFPSLVQKEQKKTVKKSSEVQKNDLQLIATSLQPKQNTKFVNYLSFNMLYNIQKKVLSSKNKYYAKLVFQSAKDSKRFLQLCQLQPHRSLLPQFCTSKTLRIGYQGDSLLISPYEDKIKGQLKNEIIKILGQGVIQNSFVITLNKDCKIWKLKIRDQKKIAEYYEKLEMNFKSNNLVANKQMYKIKVFIDYPSSE